MANSAWKKATFYMTLLIQCGQYTNSDYMAKTIVIDLPLSPNQTIVWFESNQTRYHTILPM